MDIYLVISVLLLAILLIIVILYIHLRLRLEKNVQRLAIDTFRAWMNNTLQSERENIRESIKKEYDALFEKWKKDYSEEIRKEAIKKSQEVLKGKVTEQIIPYFPDFPYDPRDVRFIGSPIDLVVFSGLRERNVVDEIVFIEIKTGKSRQSEAEKKVEEAVKNGRISYRVINIPKEIL
ncbi:MAG: hypothetical protein GPW16_04415 [Euryarchaeota archaeon]|nr:hypothetical protein [Euryarchaeota archaeon]